MCGIVGYIGSGNAREILYGGLRALEYRGYDSAGMYIPEHGVRKAVGEVAKLQEVMEEGFDGRSGIAHTRWATHGAPSIENAHPHISSDGSVALVHNGIVENYFDLKERLQGTGVAFKGDTDSEVLAELVALYLPRAGTLREALVLALGEVVGTFGIAAMAKENNEEIVLARRGSPIVLGSGREGVYAASDPSVLLRYTKDVVYLEDDQLAVLTPEGFTITDFASKVHTPSVHHIDWDIVDAQKGGYAHFMLKEIMEIPEVLHASMRGRVSSEKGEVLFGGLKDYEAQLRAITRIQIVACGTASYAGETAKHYFEELCAIPTEVTVASEYRYGAMVHDKNTALIAISQSGETADTLAAVKEAKLRGILTIGVVNVVGSSIARECDCGIYTHAGPEISVASTKAIISQISALFLMAVYFARMRTLSQSAASTLLVGLEALPEKIAELLKDHTSAKALAAKLASFKGGFTMGRRVSHAAALEAALKLKECAYIHAEGYGAGEMKHGPLALVDEQFFALAIAPSDSVYGKVVSNLEEVRARGGVVLGIADDKSTDIERYCSATLIVPSTNELLSPLLTIPAAQLLAYYAGVEKGINVDRPRNLAKSVTVE